MIYRDDDANVYTNAHQFKILHEKFIEDGKVHTVAALMKDLWENHALFYYLIIAKNLNVELHGWTHRDYSLLDYDEAYAELKMAIDYWNTNARRMLQVDELPDDKKLTTFFAPWNKESETIKKVCKDLGLKFCATQSGEWEGEEVKSFHWWNVMRVKEDYKLEDVI